MTTKLMLTMKIPDRYAMPIARRFVGALGYLGRCHHN
jgi:hypothetical protein